MTETELKYNQLLRVLSCFALWPGPVTLAAFQHRHSELVYLCNRGTSVYTGNIHYTNCRHYRLLSEAANGPCLASTRVLVTATVIPGATNHYSSCK